MEKRAYIDWKDLGDIKHRIRHSLTKAIKIELMAKELREEIAEEVNKLDEIIDKQGE